MYNNISAHLHSSPNTMERAFDDDAEEYALFGQSTGQTTPSLSTAINDTLPRDQQARNAFYDYASEKSLSHEEARLFYQRHQLEQEQQTPTESRGPSGRWESSSMVDEDAGEISRTASVTSRHDRTKKGSVESFHAADPIGIASLDKPVDSADVQVPDFRGLDPHQNSPHMYSHGSIGAADWSHDPKYNNPNNGPAEAGLGTGSGPGTGGYVSKDLDVTAELSAIYTSIQRILDIRHKYIRLSLQRFGDNPKDDPEWNIYPPPPEPVWDEENNRPFMTRSKAPSLSNSQVLQPNLDTQRSRQEQSIMSPGEPWPGTPSSPVRKRRKAGQDIGEDFELSDVLPLPGESEMEFELDDSGVYQVYENTESAEIKAPIISIPTIRDFYMDLDTILNISMDGPTKSFAFRRLQYLEGKFNLYFLLNEYQETADTKRVPHRDFYNVRKVDTHVHHSSCMNQKHLLRFIKSKMKKSPDEVVMYRDGQYLTLQQVFESINLTAYDLSINTLDMHAHTDSFHRFDKFNLKYNPIGESRLREIFLKTDNFIKGRYLAELTKEVVSDLEASKYQMVEWRISIYGKSLDEWDKVAAWVVDNKIFSPNLRWLVQIPRLFDVYKSSGLMENFEKVIVNVFQPLFEVTKNPSSHPKLFIFLQRVIGFDSVDDESKPERRLFKKFPVPKAWDTKQNPPYSYWIYFLFANITSLNVWRKQRGFNTFLLRPHCGEAGETDHLAAAVLCCHSISHGILLRKVPLMQYIFYLEQIGIAMSPLSNNALFLAYERNPFLQYFKRGLNVSLSTDDPLQIAFTKEPLIEEYSVAAQIYKLNAVDMCELAKNSVVQSGFEHAMKQRWLGLDYHLPGVAGNNVAKTNVPNIRQAFRHKTLEEEHSMIERYSAVATYSEPVSAASLPAPMQYRHRSQTGTQASPSIVGNSSGTNLHMGGLNLSGSGHQARPAPASFSNQIPRSPVQLARNRLSLSTKDLRSVDTTSPPLNSGHRSGSTATLTSAIPRTGSDLHLDGTEPRIFPGVVHERIRRSGSRIANNMEDGDGVGSLRRGVSRLGFRSVDGLGNEEEAIEENGELDNE